MSLNLEKVTLVAVDTKQPYLAVKALQESSKEINFKEIILFSDKKPFNIDEKIKFIKIKKINNLVEYSKFIANELVNFIQTDYCFTVHYDGFIINPKLWSEDFLKYDWIGAPWVKEAPFLPSNVRVGNGGVSIRSKKLMDIVAKKYPLTDGHEDVHICCNYRNLLEQENLSFAPLEIASKFSLECICDDVDVNINKVFAFHGPHSSDQKEKIKDLIFTFYKHDLIKMDKHTLQDWLRDEAGSSQPDYFYSNKKGNLTLQQIPQEYVNLLDVFKNNNINSYLELGVANGGSFFLNSIFLQKTCNVLHCVDNLAYKDTHIKQTKSKITDKVERLKKLFPEKEIHFFNTTTDLFFTENKLYYDCIFIDADHSYDGVSKDFKNALKCINKHGIIIFHDIGNKDTGVAQLWSEIKQKYSDTKEFLYSETSWYNCGIGVIFLK
jgi:hypothetical protein